MEEKQEEGKGSKREKGEKEGGLAPFYMNGQRGWRVGTLRGPLCCALWAGTWKAEKIGICIQSCVNRTRCQAPVKIGEQWCSLNAFALRARREI